MKTIFFLLFLPLFKICFAQEEGKRISVYIEKLKTAGKFSGIGDTIKDANFYFQDDSCYGSSSIVLLDTVGSYKITILKDYELQPEVYYYKGSSASILQSKVPNLNANSGKVEKYTIDKMYTPSFSKAEIPTEEFKKKKNSKIYIQKLDVGRRFINIGDSIIYLNRCFKPDSCYKFIKIFSTDSVGSYKMTCQDKNNRFTIIYCYKGDSTLTGMISDFNDRDYDEKGHIVIVRKELMYVPKLVEIKVLQPK